MYVIVKAPKQKLLWGDHGETRFWRDHAGWTQVLSAALYFKTHQKAADFIEQKIPAEEGYDLTVVSLETVPPWV